MKPIGDKIYQEINKLVYYGMFPRPAQHTLVVDSCFVPAILKKGLTFPGVK